MFSPVDHHDLEEVVHQIRDSGQIVLGGVDPGYVYQHVYCDGNHLKVQ